MNYDKMWRLEKNTVVTYVRIKVIWVGKKRVRVNGHM